MRLLVITTLLFLLTASADAIGIIVPRTPETQAPWLVSADINATIKNDIAQTRITQVFKNSNPRSVEADFYFPVPNEADITDFVLYMDGKPVKGEVLGKDEAHDIYRDIVRKMKDPGLIEWSEKNLFRVRVFPIPANGEQKLEIEISQQLKADQDYIKYTVPMEAQRHKASAFDQPKISYKVMIEADQQVRNVYSPTHEIETQSSSTKSITITARDGDKIAPKDFSLFYEKSNKDIAVSLLAHKTPGANGFFSLRIAPPWKETTTTSLSADYIFVIDTSGSMAEDDKMEQARKSLQYCIGLLKSDDRFNLIRFSTTAEPFETQLIQASQDSKNKAAGWIKNLQAKGGTNINDALNHALKLRDERTSAAGRLFTVVFITDGQPTVGQTSPDHIAKNVSDRSGGNVRIFSFGVGHDVNTRLLDTIAEKTKAVSDYVSPGADLEVPIGRFFDKVSHPALFNLELSIPGARITEMYPPELPDLFYGTELAVFGRYETAGPTAITLTGSLNEEKKSYQFEKTFPNEATDNAFLEKLWATRKVAWLLDQVRMSGETNEVRTEIEELAKKYAIVTPYTSYLAMEDTPTVTAGSAPITRRQPSRNANTFHYNPIEGTASSGDVFRSNAPASVALYSSDKKAAHSSSGAQAVGYARELRQMKSAETDEAAVSIDSRIQVVQGKTFTFDGKVWKDSAITGDETNPVKIKYLSDAWFQLTQESEEFREILALGEQVEVQLSNGTILIVGANGIETITVKEEKLLNLSNHLKKE